MSQLYYFVSYFCQLHIVSDYNQSQPLTIQILEKPRTFVKPREVSVNISDFDKNCRASLNLHMPLRCIIILT